METLLGAGLPSGRVSEIAGACLATVHRIRAQVQALRRMRRASDGGGMSAMDKLLRELRRCAVRPVARCASVASEFSQQDFGEVRVRWEGTGPAERVQYICSRLKLSRYALIKLPLTSSPRRW